MLFIGYPSCSTCKKAKKLLKEQNISFTERHIAEENPSKQELTAWLSSAGLPISKFFNTSGQAYRQGNIKERLPNLSEEEAVQLLAENGMLVKRPVLVLSKRVLIGFKEEEWKQALEEERR